MICYVNNIIASKSIDWSLLFSSMDNPPPTFTRKSWTHSTSVIFQKCQPPTNKGDGGGNSQRDNFICESYGC